MSLPPCSGSPPVGEGRIDAADAVYTLNYLYGKGDPPAPVPAAAPARESSIVYLVRHAEDDNDPEVRRLTEFGHARAAVLADRLRDAGISQVFSSHKRRTFQTVLPTAEDQGLEVQQLPPPGTVLPNGENVTESTSTSASIEPTVEAILSAPPGSVLLVGGHSSTLLAIMAGLGVPVATEDAPCEEEDVSCLPWAEKRCFPGGFDNLWTVTVGATPAADAAMARLHYGSPCEAAGIP